MRLVHRLSAIALFSFALFTLTSCNSSNDGVVINDGAAIEPLKTEQKRECSFKSNNKKLEKNSKAYKTLALFSPKQGPEAFDIIFEEIGNAQDYVYITIYSWKLDGVRSSVLKACENGAKVYIVTDKRNVSRQKNLIKELEQTNCVEIKRTTKTMHEKFVIVDDHFLMNSSANFSGGARSKYNENFIFLCDDDNLYKKEDELIDQFKHEFSILWNSGKDTKYDANGGSVGIEPIYLSKNKKTLQKVPRCNDMCLYSSSLNFDIKMKEDFSMSLRTIPAAYNVEAQILKAIDGAKTSLFMSVNYLLLDRVCESVENAIKRGVDVKVVNDNKSAKKYSDCSYKLGQKYDDLFRFKFYSFFPTPRKAILNHNKYLLVDYDSSQIKKGNPVSKNTVLVSGSHNFSETAEKTQFDNMVVFRTEAFTNLYHDFYIDFIETFELGRENKEDIFEELTKSNNGYFRIHTKKLDNLISISKKEIDALVTKLLKKAPGMLDREIDRVYFEECDFFRPEDKTFYNKRGKNFNICVPKKFKKKD